MQDSQPIAIPQNPTELADQIHQARSTQTPLVDYGQAHTGVGNPPPAIHTQLKLQPADHEHYRSDMTLSVSAGNTFAQTQQALLAENQFLPIDADDDMTIGEIIAHNTQGPLRVGYGTIRDLILGLGFIDGQGNDIRAGGRTVKNVAGYDLTRFMVGSLGEFGCIYQATLRTYAKPPEITVITLTLQDPTPLDQLTTTLLTCDARPLQALLTCSNQTWTLRLVYPTHSKGTPAQLNALHTLIAPHPTIQFKEQPICIFEDDQAQRASLRHWLRTANTVIKIMTPPALTAHTCKQLILDHNTKIHATPTHGQIFAGGDLTEPAANQLATTATNLAIKHHGYTLWYRRPSHLLHHPPSSPTRPDINLLIQLKQAFNPDNILNPNRFIPTQTTKSH